MHKNRLAYPASFSLACRLGSGDVLISPPLAGLVERVALSLAVVDTGAGLSAEEQESIFQAYERGKAGREGDSGGSGVGLAVVDRLVKDPAGLAQLKHLEFVREAGAEGIELVMWLIMRGALGPEAQELYRFYHVPGSNTAVGHLVLQSVETPA